MGAKGIDDAYRFSHVNREKKKKKRKKKAMSTMVDAIAIWLFAEIPLCISEVTE